MRPHIPPSIPRIWLGRLLALCLAGAAGAAVAAEADVVRMAPGQRLNSLASQPDTDQVQLSDGKRVRLGDLRRIDQAGQRLRSGAASAVVPAPLRHKPAATGIRVDNPAALAEALKRPDSDTVVLPSGRRVTVGQIRFAQPRVEMRLGRPLGVLPARPGLSGPATRVDARSDWKAILAKPDQTVLESPTGKRITVGELKQAIRTGALPKATVPARQR